MNENELFDLRLDYKDDARVLLLIDKYDELEKGHCDVLEEQREDLERTHETLQNTQAAISHYVDVLDSETEKLLNLLY